ncbi:unnamed protein product, partial [Ixodes pacificus]
KRSDHSPSARAQSDVTINISIIIRRSRRCTAADARKMASSPASLTSPARSARETDHILGVGVIHLEIRTHTIHFPDRRTIVMPSPRHELTETASVDSKIPHHERAKLPLSKHSTFSLAFTLGSVSWSSLVVICWQSVTTTTTVSTIAKWTWLRGDAAPESD